MGRELYQMQKISGDLKSQLLLDLSQCESLKENAYTGESTHSQQETNVYNSHDSGTSEDTDIQLQDNASPAQPFDMDISVAISEEDDFISFRNHRGPPPNDGAMVHAPLK